MSDPIILEAAAQAIRAAISEIPASNPSYISSREETLDNVLSPGLLHKVAREAALAALAAIAPRIEAAALENAAKVAECFIAANGRPTAYNDQIAALIRFLIPDMPANDIS